MVRHHVRSGDTEQVGVKPIFWTTSGVMLERRKNVGFDFFEFALDNDELLVQDFCMEIRVIWLPDIQLLAEG